MIKRVPTAKQMEDSRKLHFFRDANDDRTVIVTELLPNGRWGAGLDDADGEMPGDGATRLEAIADLVEQIRKAG